jgi:plasmid stabilization system protein ParE
VSTNLPIFVDPRAEEDIDAAVQWYAIERLDLASEFLNAIDDVFVFIGQFPKASPEVDSGIRRALVKKFPFCIYYTVNNGYLTVFAVLHIRRSPDTWQERM